MEIINATAGNISEKTEVICFDGSGKFKVWRGIVVAPLRSNDGKNPLGFTVRYDDGSKEPKETLVHTKDLCPVGLLPAGLISLLNEQGLIVPIPFEPLGTLQRLDAARPARTDAPPPQPPAGRMFLKTKGGDIPADFDWSKFMGQPFHDAERKPIGTIVETNPTANEMTVAIYAGMEELVRGMLKRDLLPGMSEVQP